MYDRAGNRTDGGRTYNAANQVAGWTYDNAGNLTSDGTTSYTYDALSRVASSTAGGSTRTNTYNGDGTLVGQTVGTTTTSPPTLGAAAHGACRPALIVRAGDMVYSGNPPAAIDAARCVPQRRSAPPLRGPAKCLLPA